VAEADPGYGPPPGKPSGTARQGGGSVTFDQLAKQYMSGLDVDTDDIAHRKPIDTTDSNTRARAKLVYRDVPLVTVQNTWSVPEARGAMYAHLIGQFYASGQLCDSILGDDRVTATLNARATALFGRESRFKAADDSAAAKECLDAWEKWWPRLIGTSALRETSDYGTMMGFAHDQVLWHRKVSGLDYAPELRPWHPVFTYYDWDRRCYMAIGSDGVIPIVGGNGKWLEFTPFGGYRGWMRGAMRPVVEPWMLRHFGFRDMARFGEVHGNPTRKGIVPIVGDPIERQNFETALAGLGADAALIVPGGVDGQDGQGYDYELVEATSQAWKVHPAQIDRCDMAIVLAILMVNLTTEVGEGSLAASKTHAAKENAGTQFDNMAWKHCLYTQLARPFAYLNFGNADLAPWTWWDVTPIEQYTSNADQFLKFSQGLLALRQGGIEFSDPDEVQEWASKTLGLPGLPKFTVKEPVAPGGMGGTSNASPPKLDPNAAKTAPPTPGKPGQPKPAQPKKAA
jgi:hypothetical protein